MEGRPSEPIFINVFSPSLIKGIDFPNHFGHKPPLLKKRVINLTRPQIQDAKCI